MTGIRRLTQAVAAAAVCAVVATACGGSSSGGTSSSGGSGGSGSSSNQASAPGVTATTVTIGSHQPLTGPAAPGYSEIAPASKAMFDYINAQGGVNGRKINYIYKDDGYNPTKTVDVVRQLVLQDNVFAIFSGLGTPTHTKVLDFLNSHKVPDLFVSSGSLSWDQPKKYPYTFGWQPDYTVEGKILGQYVKQNFAGQKVGYLLQNDDFGTDGAKGLDKYLKDAVVDRQTYESGNIDIAPQINSLKSKGTQVLVCECIPAYTALAKLNALKLGWNPTFVVSNVGSDPITLAGLMESFAKQAGASVNGSQLTEGIVTDGYLPAFTDTSSPWAQLFKKVHDQAGLTSPLDGNVEYGMAQAYTFAVALKAAGKNPTRDSIVKAVETADLSGPGLVPFRFSRDSHAGYTGTQIAIIKNGALSYVGQPLVTDDGDGPITPYTKGPGQVGAHGILQP